MTYSTTNQIGWKVLNVYIKMVRGWFRRLDVECLGTLLLQGPGLVGAWAGDSPWGLWASPLSGLWGGGLGKTRVPLNQCTCSSVSAGAGGAGSGPVCCRDTIHGHYKPHCLGCMGPPPQTLILTQSVGSRGFQ